MNDDSPLRRIRDWPTFFEEVRWRPAMWLGRPSLACLRALLAGFALAEDLYAVGPERLLTGFPFVEFEAWVAQRFNPERLTLDSFGLAGRLTASDEAALSHWFGWYDDFNRGRGRT